MNIVTSIERVDRLGHGALFLNIVCDGMGCGRVLIASGPIAGTATLPEITERWFKKC